MSDINLKLEFRISQSVIRWGLSALLLACCAPELASESVTLNTYYPAPSGVYTQMITTNNSYLARDGGKVSIGGNTSPSYELDVTGDGRFTTNLTVGNNLTVSGGESIGGNLTVGGNETVNGTLLVNNNATVTGTLTATNLQVNNNATVNGTLTAGTLQVNNTATINGNLYAQQGVRVWNSIVARQTGCFFVRWTTGGVNTGTSPSCSGGYITNQSGFYSEWMSATSLMYTNNGTDSPGAGEALCCPYGAIGGQF